MPTPRPERRADASMDLLATITRNALDPQYREVAARPGAARRGGPLLGVGLVLAGGLMAMAAVQTTRSAPSDAQERTQLVEQVRRAEDNYDAQNRRLAELDDQVKALQASRGVGATPGDESDRLGLLAGSLPVVGPGAVVQLDDGPTTATGSDTVTDQDLRQVVNGLWAAGAEAIAVNGRRLSARTAIRMAGSAITVDYRSVSAPYRVEAIGDPDRLPANFAKSSGGSWCEYLRLNFNLTCRVEPARSLRLAADPGLGVGVARPGG